MGGRASFLLDRPTPADAPGRRAWALAGAAMATGLSIAMFAWILDLGFWVDDFVHLYNLANSGYARLALTPHGGHLLLVSNSTYFLLHALFGLSPRPWFLIVLLVHAVNVALLFRAIDAWTSRLLLSTVLATLWGISPANQASLSWFAVFGHVLTATFVLWLLGDIGRARATAQAIPPSMRAKWGLLLLAAATSFGIGLGIGLAFAPAAVLLLPRQPDQRPVLRVFLGCAAFLLALYAAQTWIVDRLWGADLVPFSVAPLVPIALSAGVGHVAELSALTFVGLMGYGLTTLLLGPFALFAAPGRFLGPWRGDDLVWCARAVLALFVAASVALVFRREPARRIASGLGVLVAAAYLPVAAVVAVRALVMPELVNPATLVLQPRYQYVGPALLAVLLGMVISAALDRWPRLSALPPILLAMWIVSNGERYWQARDAMVSRPVRSATSAERAAAAIERLRATVRESPPGSIAYVENGPAPFPWLEIGAAFPRLAAFFVIYHPDDQLDGRRIRFIERDPDLLRAVRSGGGRIAGLLVGPEEVPAQ